MLFKGSAHFFLLQGLENRSDPVEQAWCLLSLAALVPLGQSAAVMIEIVCYKAWKWWLSDSSQEILISDPGFKVYAESWFMVSILSIEHLKPFCWTPSWCSQFHPSPQSSRYLSILHLFARKELWYYYLMLLFLYYYFSCCLVYGPLTSLFWSFSFVITLSLLCFSFQLSEDRLFDCCLLHFFSCQA